jgi:hypothetical protein
MQPLPRLGDQQIVETVRTAGSNVVGFRRPRDLVTVVKTIGPEQDVDRGCHSEGIGLESTTY